jgi:hypothetical protein
MTKMMTYAASAALAALTLTANLKATVPLIQRVNVPFGFTIQNQQLPAGEYEVRMANDQMVNLYNRDTRQGYTLLTPIRFNRGFKGSKSHLVFHCYGEACSLRQVWFSGSEYGVGTREGAQERASRLARGGAPVVASIRAR